MDSGSKDRYFDLSGAMLPVNRNALQTARPWAWRRILDGLPPSPQPDAVGRPNGPFTLRLTIAGVAVHLHSRLDPAGEAAALLPRAALAQARCVVVLGFGAGHLVEQALAAAPTGCTVTALVVDPGSFLCTLAHRELPTLLADPRLILAVGDLRELEAALPGPSTPALWLVHAPVLKAASPELAPLIERAPARLLAGGVAQGRRARRSRDLGRLNPQGDK